MNENVGIGVIALSAITLIKNIADLVVGYLNKNSDLKNNVEVALLKKDHARCEEDAKEMKIDLLECKSKHDANDKKNDQMEADIKQLKDDANEKQKELDVLKLELKKAQAQISGK